MLKSNLSLVIFAIVLSIFCYQRASQLRYAATISDAMNQVDEFFVEPVDRRQLFESAMRGMVRELDPYSSYIPPGEYEELQEEIEQQFGGIGVAVELDPEAHRPVIINVRPNGPADRAGIRVGDVIVKISGRETEHMEAGDPLKLIRGEPGTTVALTIQSLDEKSPREVLVERAVIPIETVIGYDLLPDGKWRFTIPDQPQIGYIWLDSFGENTSQELADAMEQIRPQVHALILDLRANPGGLLTAAVKISDAFVDRGTIVTVRSRVGERVYDAIANNELCGPRVPLVVLVDRYSASASEIVAACLQDDHRAVILGERTWGKGTVQSVIEMEGGRSALRLTTATYWRPSGKNIHRRTDAKEDDSWGVRPDPGFEFKLSNQQYLQMIRARQNRALGRPKSSSETETESADPQLTAAIEYLRKELSSRQARMTPSHPPHPTP